MNPKTCSTHEPLLANLNAAQRLAVTSTDGPTLILAGAGTGKTNVITHRLAYLLASRTDLHTENILALTYTRKAAEEMAVRIEELLPQMTGIPKVMTFHSFALELIQEHALALGLSPQTKLLSQTLERATLLEPILWNLPLESFSKVANRSSLAIPILRFIDRAKDELVTPGEYRAFASSAEEKELAEIYALYEEALRKRDALDFGGLLELAIELLKTKPQIAQQLSEQFRYILVDEFQDTNIAQIEFLRLLTWKHKNICAVGDDDQAIYRFRGASYASFKKFREIFPEVKILKLTQNYRSTQNILQVAGAVIAVNGKDRYDETKELWTQNPAGEPLGFHVFPSYEDEAAWIAGEIRRRLDAGEDLSQIAVLIRAHSHGEKIKEALKREQIPFVEASGAKLLDEQEIRDALALLNLIGETEEDISLARILLSHYVGLTPAEYRLIAEWAKKEKDAPLPLVLDQTETVPFLAQETRARLKTFNEKISKLKVAARRLTISELFWELLVTFKMLAGYLHKGTLEAEKAVQHLGLFSQWVHDFESSDTKKSPLHKLMRTLALAQDLDLDPEIEAGLPPSNALRLMTIHAAKGLEFATVFIASVNDGRFPSREKSELIPFPDALMKEALPQGDFHIEEERRLFYVGLTRAEKELHLCCVEKPRVKPSVFVREILASDAKGIVTTIKHDAQGTRHALPVEEIPAGSDEEILAFVKKYFIRTKPAPAPTAAAQPAQRKLTLSHTQMETYEWCPLKYQFSYIYRVPKPGSPHLAFGINMHKTLEEFYRLIKEGKSAHCENLLALYEKYWVGRGFKSKAQEETYKKKGAEVLKNYFETNQHDLNPPLFLEEPFLVKIQDDLEIIGKIDRVQELAGGTVEVIDYKTGKAKDQKYADSSLQLSIYAMALEQMSGRKVSRLSFYYLEAGEQISTEVDSARIKKACDKIIDTAQKIRGGVFPPIPENDRFMKCKICEYKPLCPVWER